MTDPRPITAKTLLDLLLSKHQKRRVPAVCVPECKTGSSWSAGKPMQSMDLWVMEKSWAKPRIIVYEIKVSRKDFVSDTKWPGYLAYGNEFYFVAPPGLIDKEELPEEAGLMVCSKNATRLYTKKKSPYRRTEVPDSVFRYVLMWRAKINEKGRKRESPVEFWQRWLDEKQKAQQVGHAVSRKLGERIEREVVAVQDEIRALRTENETLQDVKTFLINSGISEWDIKRGFLRCHNRLDRLIREAKTGVPTGIRESLANAIHGLTNLREAIETHVEKTSS